MPHFRVLAVEPQPDGSKEVFGPDYAKRMHLPFSYGWDHWGVYQGTRCVFASDDFRQVHRTCAIMNATVLPIAA